MKTHRAIVCCLAAPLLAFTASTAVVTAGEPAPKLRALLLTGLNHHNWQETTPEIIGSLEESGRFTVTRIDPPSPVDAEASAAFRIDLSDVDVVVNNWTDFRARPPEDAAQYFPWMDQVLDYVRGGGAYVGIHAASFERHPEFLALVGLHWRRPQAGVRITATDDGTVVTTPRGEGPGSGHGPLFKWSLRGHKPEHPVLSGLLAELPRQQRDELWHGVRGPAENLELLATAWSPITEAHEPMLWTIRFGEGRVFVTLLGHDGPSMRCEVFRHTLARGTEWAATGAVTLAAPAALAR